MTLFGKFGSSSYRKITNLKGIDDLGGLFAVRLLKTFQSMFKRNLHVHIQGYGSLQSVRGLREWRKMSLLAPLSPGLMVKQNLF